MKKEKDKAVEVDTLSFDQKDIVRPEENYIPEGFESVDAYLEDARETHQLDLEADDDNRKAALEDKKFTAGEQWDPAVLAARAGLPVLTINTIPQFTAQLVGDWRENRNGVKVIPNTDGDKEIADIRSDIIRSIQTKSRADRILDSAFESMVQCGDGAFRIAVQYANEDVFDQEILFAPIDDCLSVVWDRLSIDPTGRDARRCFVDDVIPNKEFDKNFPDAKSPSTMTESDARTFGINGWIDNGTCRVTEHWRLIDRDRLLGMFQDGSIHVIEGDKLDEMIQKHGQLLRTRLSPCRYAQMHLITGWEILAGPYEYKLNRLPIIRMSGRTVSIGSRRVRFGIVRDMKDPARLRNFWRSVAAEQIGYAPKAQWIATETAVEGREDVFRKAHLTRNPLLVINEGAVIGQDIQRVEPPVMQTALLNEAQINTQDMKDVTGIHDASLGIKSNETSGKAIMARQREGDVASLTYYDNGNSAVLEAGDVINQLIGQIYDGTRIIRTIGEDESTKLVKINDPMDPKSPDLSVGTYDVAITSGPSYTTRRVEAAQSMMDAIQVYPELMQIAGDLVVKAQDWPGAEELAERLQKTIPPQLLSDKDKAAMGEQAPDMQKVMEQGQQMQQAIEQGKQELEKLQKENYSLKIKHDIEAKKLEIDTYKAETDRLTAYANLAKAGEEMKLRTLEQQADLAFGIHDATLAQGQHDLAVDQHGLAADQQGFDQEMAQQDANEPSEEPASTQPTQ